MAGILREDILGCAHQSTTHRPAEGRERAAQEPPGQALGEETEEEMEEDSRAEMPAAHGEEPVGGQERQEEQGQGARAASPLGVGGEVGSRMDSLRLD